MFSLIHLINSLFFWNFFLRYNNANIIYTLKDKKTLFYEIQNMNCVNFMLFQDKCALKAWVRLTIDLMGFLSIIFHSFRINLVVLMILGPLAGFYVWLMLQNPHRRVQIIANFNKRWLCRRRAVSKSQCSAFKATICARPFHWLRFTSCLSSFIWKEIIITS